jgi:hypothetical protein
MLLRLLPGDDGYVAWSHGKLAFVDTVSTVVHDAQEEVMDDLDDDDDSDHEMDPEDLVKEMMEDFPIIPDEI